MIYSVWPRVPYTFSSNIAKLQKNIFFEKKKKNKFRKKFCNEGCQYSRCALFKKKKKKALKVLNYKNGF